MSSGRTGPRSQGRLAVAGTGDFPTAELGDRLAATLGVRADRYLIRAAPTISEPVDKALTTDPGSPPRSLRCTLEAVVVVDGQGRVPLCPVPSLDRPVPSLAISTQKTFAVLSTLGRGVPVSIDSRLRMLLPRPILRRLGLGAGDRAAIVRLSASTLALTRVDQLTLLTA